MTIYIHLMCMNLLKNLAIAHVGVMRIPAYENAIPGADHSL